MEGLEEAIDRNVSWFLNSGILVDEGKGGVYERVVLLHPQHHLVQKSNWEAKLTAGPLFQYQRVDCAMQTALAFAVVDKVKENKQLIQSAQNLIDFVFSAGFQELNPESQEYGLFAHGMNTNVMPRTFNPKKWVDDNSWLVITSYALHDLGYSVDLDRVNLCANALVDKVELLDKNCRGNIAVPHWGGMAMMATGFAFAYTHEDKFRDAALMYANLILDKPTQDLSNHSYFSMQTGSVLKVIFGLKEAVGTADHLVSRQHEDGHFPAEWWEGSKGEHIADLVYVQNWANLALQIASTHDPEYRPAFEKSMKFLLDIQNRTASPLTNGAWQGAYDTNTKLWGGEDKKEGGPSMLYSGWTNAPILLSLAIEATGKNPLIL